MAAPLAGCTTTARVTGAIAGAATGLVSANPAVGIGIGITVQAVTDEAINRTVKHLHQNQQDAIVRAAGALGEGEVTPWRVRNPIPMENDEGDVRVTRVYTTALAPCRDFLFSVKTKAKADWYFATACQQGATWKWASAEPAVERWGNLQ